MRPDNRPSREPIPRAKPTPPLGLKQIRKRQIALRLIQPAREAVHEPGTDGRGGDGGDLEHPVRFGVEVARVEGKAVVL